MGTTLVELKTTVALMHKDNELFLSVVQTNHVKIAELYTFHE
jgi:hypothetical protein